MAQGLNSTRTAARPAHEAIEQNADATVAGKTERQKMDKIGMEAAKRAGNRIHSEEEKNPEDSMFTK
jgi:hypothetical protein